MLKKNDVNKATREAMRGCMDENEIANSLLSEKHLGSFPGGKLINQEKLRRITGTLICVFILIPKFY